MDLMSFQLITKQNSNTVCGAVSMRAKMAAIVRNLSWLLACHCDTGSLWEICTIA